MACRFPGAPDIPSFWRLLATGTDAVTEGVPGSDVGRVGQLFPDGGVQSEACRFGAYLDDLDRFDAAFFRISPAEAERLDPQQRLMLEVSWQALEDAGIAPDRLEGSRTGVYAGISNNEYRGLILEADETAEPAASLYSVTGTSFNTAIGRVAFALGLQGPALALDTACSSSLVAAHQAIADLQRGDADLALAGGVHTILSGRLLELRGNAGMLSPDGRCKTFDASANGYVRGEGCGIVVLKRLRDAEADGDRIWGVIRGSAVNQDGASAGLTVPNPKAQESVIGEALARAGIQPIDVDYLEAHGTGTEVGDPIEIEAAGAAYGTGRPADRPLLIGSVKTNFGHLESAAGVAGLIKVVLAMRHGVIPKHLHFRNPNPTMDWERLPLRVTAAQTDWPVHLDRPPRAGVSGFGWSGTNAHLVVEGYPPPNGTTGGPGNAGWPSGAARRIAVQKPESVPDPLPAGPAPQPRIMRLLPLSGKSEDSLREIAEGFLAWLDDQASGRDNDGDGPLADLAWTAGVGRNHFSRRAGVVFRDEASLRQRLAEIAGAGGSTGPDAPGQTVPKVAFLYTGQASQWVGMGEDLYRTEPVFRAILHHCDRLFEERRGASLLDAMFGRGDSPPELDDPAWKQPAIYALECALTGLWSSLGIRPGVVLGHSLGELAAAQAAGVFSLADGLRFAALRGELIGAVPGAGRMGAIFAPRSEVAAAVAEQNARISGFGLSVAADNGAHQIVSGPADDVEAILERFDRRNIRVRRLRKSPAYHSAMLDPALDDLEAALAKIPVAPPSIPFVSNLDGRVRAPDRPLDGRYWRRQTREPVEFRRCVETLAAMGVRAVVEIGPHAVLGPMASLAWPESTGGDGAPVVVSSLRRPSRETPADAEGSFVRAVATAYEAGLPISFPGLFAGESRRRVPLPGYPFQRERHWIKPAKRRRLRDSHPLLGTRHESASGELGFETEVAATDPPWLGDHRVFDRLVAPGALYGAMAVSASSSRMQEMLGIGDFQLHNPLILAAGDDDSRRLQVVLDPAAEGTSRRVRVLSRADGGEWTLHAEGVATPGEAGASAAPRIDPEDLKNRLAPEDISAFYRGKAAIGIGLGSSFRTLRGLWSGPNEALAEITLPADIDPAGIEMHPLLLDGCFQAMAAARRTAPSEDGVTYLPFAWERLWRTGDWPESVWCHVRSRQSDGGRPGSELGDLPEVLSADLRIYDRNGVPLGGLDGYTIKRATRASLLAAVEGLDDLLYEVVWRDGTRSPAMPAADFLPDPRAVRARSKTFVQYLAAEDVGADSRAALLDDLERLAGSYAVRTLDQLGWERRTGAVVDPEDLRQRLKVTPNHTRLFRRMLEMLARSGLVEECRDGFRVTLDSGDPLPVDLPADPGEFATHMAGAYAHGTTEIGLFRRSAEALPEVLRGRADPLTLLFSSGEPTAADLYLKAPAARAANRMLGDAIRALVAGLPDDRDLRVIEVGAGTGSATASVLPELPGDRLRYVYTDISAGFFAEAEARFGDGNGAIEYRVLDIEKEPVAQGFDPHGYDLLIASNVLHATRYLDETLAHCGALLAPSGQLVALENLRGQGWLDLTFGQLDGWWRFADRYRPRHALSGPPIWRRALGDAGFGAIEFLGVDDSEGARPPDRGIIMAAGPAEVTLPGGVWVVAADCGGVAAELAIELTGRNQTVVLAEQGAAGETGKSGIERRSVDFRERESWGSLLATLPGDLPLNGIVHLAALDGPDAPTDAMAKAVRHVTGSALALAQALVDADLRPAKGVWFVTRGAQVLEKERGGQVVGATLWGLGKVVAREAPHLLPRMLDLDPERPVPMPDLAEELLFPDPETQIAYREARRRVARLVRAGAGEERLPVPEGPDWLLTPDPGGALEKLHPEPMPRRSLGPRDVRVVIDATGLNFWDVFRSIGFIPEGLLGGEMCGRVLEVGEDVSAVSAGDRIVGLAFGTFGAEVTTHEEMVTPAPPDVPASELATLPTAFVSAQLSYDLAELKAGERVLIHAGAGGVGLAAIQLAQAAGAEVFATASAPKQDFLRSLGVEHVFDSRRTDFGSEALEATGGQGVQVVVNSLTGEGFVEASLLCLAEGGRFVELSRRGILTEEEMAAARPDVAYSILELDDLKENRPAIPGDALRRVMRQFTAGEITPLIHSRWPLAEARAGMRFMQAARHLGKIVFTAPSLRGGRLRSDRTYLVTGGLGGIGCALAGWLADKGAGAIVLNGRRVPDPAAKRVIGQLGRRGVDIRVEIADVTDAAAVDAMLTRIDANLPPLAGVIHSVGVLSDRALGNQTWADFERVLWPKVLGSWHLHRATADRDLDLFVLFSSVAGTLGNPGQANHAAANAFLDQLAAYRRALGLPGQAIAWGAWSGLGEAEEQRERITRQLAATGTGWFSPQQGLRAFERLLHEDAAASVVLAADWAAFAEAVENPPPVFEELLSNDADAGDAPGLGAEPLLTSLRQTPAESREETLISFLRQEVQAVLRLPKPPAPKVGFFDLGMDSLMAVELRNRLNREFAGEYSAPNTVVFDHPDIAALAAFLSMELAEAGKTGLAQARPQPSAPVATPPTEDRIAIIGMACHFPGAPDLAAFWAALEAGRDAVTGQRPLSGGEVPGDASNGDAWRSGGFIKGVDQFDARFFRITPIDARTMDPQQRLLLETSWHALEDAGIDPERLRGSRTGVYAGVAASEYRDLMMRSRDGVSYLGTARSMAVGRLAFKLGLMGPTLPVELNCASSLVAVHQAASGLRQREANLALVGGVNVILSRSVTTEMAALGMLSPTGRCRTFDAAADGFVRGEGCGVLVLKRLAEAEADGDRIWAVIRGSAVNQNGASAGPTVPNGSAQEQVIEAALERAGFSGSELDYLEAHGNGSGLGDPIEARAAAAVYGRGRDLDRPLLMGSVKTNIGHLETAAGVAGLIKAVLAMNRRVIPKHLHFENPTPYIDWDRLPVRVTSETTDWPAVPDRPPRAAVSAFGVSGTNAHVVVEGYGVPGGAANESLPAGWPAGPGREVPVAIADSVPIPSAELGRRVHRVLPLSGKTEAALRELAGRYLGWLDGEGEQGSTPNDDALADMAWTAGVGRGHFRHRAGLVFRDAATLRRGLEAVCAGDGFAAQPPWDEAPQLAFAYGGQGDAGLVVSRDLYETEPVVRAILDRCEAVMREETGMSLLEAMFPRGPWAANEEDRASEEPVRYALQCAITAFWASVGVQPAVVVGEGDGNLAAAQTAGALQLEAGLRCAVALGTGRQESTREPDRGAFESVLGTAETAPLVLPWLRLPGGQLVTPGETSPEAKGGDPSGPHDVAEALSELEARVVVNVGPGAAFGLPLLDRQAEPTSQAAADAARPGLASLGTGAASAEDFVTAVAKAYAAGLGVSFAGLFAGEQRRLVSLPAYPFQHRRHWLRERDPEG